MPSFYLQLSLDWSVLISKANRPPRSRELLSKGRRDLARYFGISRPGRDFRFSCDLLTPYGFGDLDQHWFAYGFSPSRSDGFTWTIVVLLWIGLLETNTKKSKYKHLRSRKCVWKSVWKMSATSCRSRCIDSFPVQCIEWVAAIMNNIFICTGNIVLYQYPWFTAKTIYDERNVVSIMWSTKTRRSRMMTSSNGNIFRVTGHLCGEFTGHRWIPGTKASDADLWCFPWSSPE